MRHLSGFTLLECMVVLTISVTLSCLAFSYWHGIVASQAVRQDVSILMKTFKSTQIRAMASHQVTRVCGNVDCDAPWEDKVVIVQPNAHYQAELSGKTRLIARAFPAQKQHQFTFTAQGMTDFQNASIYVCSKTSPIARRLRINQAGRVSVSDENVFEAC
jgi:prepilin-type N-terminal cleavage/methylation domain-containing protein